MDVNQNPGKVVEEVVNNGPEVEETDAYMADLIKEVESEFADEDLAALPDFDENGEVAPAGEGDEEAAPPGDGDEVAPPDEDADEPGFERLVAREVALREKEKAFEQREAQVTALEKRNQELEAHIEELNGRVPQDFFEELRTSPTDTLRNQGYDPEHLVRVILAEKLIAQGKEVPKELLREIKDAENDFKQRRLDRRQTEFEQRLAAQRFVEKTHAEARQYVNALTTLKPEFSKDAPTVAKVAKTNPERVHAEILDEIGRDAEARRREPNAQLISFAEAARRVEKRWAEFRKLTADSQEEASTPAGETQARAQQPGASTQKKAAKPLPPPAKPKTQEELEQEGLNAALAEYKRVEIARRGGNKPLARK